MYFIFGNNFGNFWYACCTGCTVAGGVMRFLNVIFYDLMALRRAHSMTAGVVTGYAAECVMSFI